MTSHAVLTRSTHIRREDDLGLGLLQIGFEQLAHSPLWQAWAECDERLAWCHDLAEARAAWGRRDERSHQVITALTGLACTRGGNDDDAGLALLVLLEAGLTRVGIDLRDLCTPSDVISAAWEVIKAAEPTPGPRAASFIIKRTHQRLVRQAKSRRSVEATPMSERYDETFELNDADAVAPVEDPVGDVVDLLQWARTTGVIDDGEVSLLVELMAAETRGDSRGQALALAGERRGVTPRTVNRCEVAAHAKLRAALPNYLAATA